MSNARGTRVRGRVKSWNAEKGFGFLGSLDADYFCHHSAIEGEGFKALADNAEVEFEVEANPSNGKLHAVNVTGPNGAPLQFSGRPPGKGKGRGRGKASKGDSAGEWSWSSGGGGCSGGYGSGKASRKGSSGPRPHTVFVAGLSWETSADTLREHFEMAGEVVDAYVVMDRETGRSRGFGKVSFAAGDQQQRAIEQLHDSELDGRNIAVREDVPPQAREGKGGAGGGSQGSKGWRTDEGWRPPPAAGASGAAAAPAQEVAGSGFAPNQGADAGAGDGANAAAGADDDARAATDAVDENSASGGFRATGWGAGGWGGSSWASGWSGGAGWSSGWGSGEVSSGVDLAEHPATPPPA